MNISLNISKSAHFQGRRFMESTPSPSRLFCGYLYSLRWTDLHQLWVMRWVLMLDALTFVTASKIIVNQT